VKVKIQYRPNYFKLEDMDGVNTEVQISCDVTSNWNMLK